MNCIHKNSPRLSLMQQLLSFSIPKWLLMQDEREFFVKCLLLNFHEYFLFPQIFIIILLFASHFIAIKSMTNFSLNYRYHRSILKIFGINHFHMWGRSSVQGKFNLIERNSHPSRNFGLLQIFFEAYLLTASFGL